MSERDFEAEARSEGWVPIEEWKGAPEKHVDAETFVRRGEEILPIVNAKNRRLSETVERLQHKVDELSVGNEQFKQFHQEFAERKDKETQELRRQLEQKRQEAIDNSDGKAFAAADRQLQELDRRPKENGTQEVMSPETKAWLSENEWYTNDRGLRAMADGLAEGLAKTRPDLVGTRGFLDELSRQVKEEAPTKFQNPNRDRSPVTTEGPKGASKGGRTFEDLPPEAQEAAMRFEKTHGLSREDYCKQYPWED